MKQSCWLYVTPLSNEFYYLTYVKSNRLLEGSQEVDNLLVSNIIWQVHLYVEMWVKGTKTTPCLDTILL